MFLICGGRDFTNHRFVYQKLTELKQKFPDITIVHGGARGVDSYAGMWAKDNSVPCEVFPADWGTLGKAAGVIRNQQMLDAHEYAGVVAFPGGPGTAHMVSIAKKKGLKVWQPGLKK